MQHQEGNNVNIIKDGRVTSVPIQRTKPVKRKRVLENITKEENDREEEAETEVERDETTKDDDQKEEVTTSKTRPKRGEKTAKSYKEPSKVLGRSQRCWVKF